MSDGAERNRDGTGEAVATDRAAAIQNRAMSAVRSAGRVAFGDRLGLTLFLGAVLWCGALWRVGIFITDTVTVANALANVANGHLAILDSPYALTLGEQPGLVEVDGQAYGRNYGHVLLALPLLLLLQAGTALVAPKLLLAGAWSLGLVAFAGQFGRLTGREQIVAIGSVGALIVFVGNVLSVTALPEGVLALVALQLSTIFAAAFVAFTAFVGNLRISIRVVGWFFSSFRRFCVVLRTRRIRFFGGALVCPSSRVFGAAEPVRIPSQLPDFLHVDTSFLGTFETLGSLKDTVRRPFDRLGFDAEDSKPRSVAALRDFAFLQPTLQFLAPLLRVSETFTQRTCSFFDSLRTGIFDPSVEGFVLYSLAYFRTLGVHGD